MGKVISFRHGELLDRLNRAKYESSYSKAGKDPEIMAIAEEGMVAYLRDLEEDLDN